jgi:hypothetical protein
VAGCPERRRQVSNVDLRPPDVIRPGDDKSNFHLWFPFLTQVATVD